jgi:hypothetical protein
VFSMIYKINYTIFTLCFFKNWLIYFSIALRLDLNSMRWTLLGCKGEPPAYRDFHSATAIGDCMYVFGGRCDNGTWPGAGQSTEYYPNTISYLVQNIRY